MSRETPEILLAPSPFQNNLSMRAAASTAARTAPIPGPGTAAGACATTPPGSLASSAISLLSHSSCVLHFTVRIMRILDRYIVREVFRHAFLGLIVFTFVFFVPQLIRLMELFVRHSGSGAQILKLFLCIFPGVFTFTIPMAVLIGVLLGLGRMSADSEIIALTALGIGRRRILLPVGVLGLAGSIATLAMRSAWPSFARKSFLLS